MMELRWAQSADRIISAKWTTEQLYDNRRMCEIIESNLQGKGQVLTDPVHESELRLWIERQLEALTEETQPFSTGLELQGDAATQYFSVGIYALNWYESNAFAFVFTDISFEKEQLHSLQYTAYTDMLTQLNSRHYGMMILNEWISEKMEFILCFVDIDNLKYVNDRYGHYEGDRYIIEVAKVLRAFSSEAVLCRLGGDEFLILARGWKINNLKSRPNL